MRRKLLCTAAILALSSSSSSATAEPPHPPKKWVKSDSFLSLPFVFGVDTALVNNTTTSTGFFWGWRPELIFAWVEGGKDPPLGFGVGPYTEIVGSTGTSQVWLGGGATVVGYIGRVGVAASAGIDSDWVRAVPNASAVFGLFVGFRTAELGGIDLPFGVRVDYRPSMGDVPTTIIVSAQLDLLVGLAAVTLTPLLRGLN